MLKQRLITAIALISLFLGMLLYATPPIFCMFTEVIVLWGAWEWSLLMGLKKPIQRFIFLFVIFTLMQSLFFIPVPIDVCIALFFVSLLFWVLTVPLIMLYPRVIFWKKSKICQVVMGVFVLVPSWFAINFVRDVDANGQYLLLYLFALIWSADIAAYFSGRRWGKRSLAPHVSPGKTWAGVCGGMVAALLLTLGTLYWFGTSSHFWPYTLTLTFFTVAFSVVGDLFESMLKRSEGLKDSGSLLPGHGGLLDRIDSLTAAAPIFTLGAIYLSRLTSQM